MVPLARALRDRGHEVRWATGAEGLPRVEAAGIPAAAAGLPSNGIRLAEYRRRFPDTLDLPPTSIPDQMFPKLWGVISAPPMLADLLTLVDPRPDLLIHDAAELAGPIVAASLGIPSVTHSFGGLIPAHRVAAAADEVAPLWASLGLEVRPYAGCYDHLYLDIYPPSLQGGAIGHVPRIQAVRPVAFDASGGEIGDPVLPEGDLPLVYLTFGTVFADETRFLAAVNAITGLDVRLLVTVGPGGDPGLLGEQPPRVRVERYVPQTSLFPHCDVVVSHGGSGTFLGALTEALPQLCLPQGADQFLNAAACAQSGAGLSLLPDAATPASIADAVNRLLTETSFRERSAGLAGEIAAMPGPDEVAKRLEGDFVP
jgi:UDP:flavonoid glycosyltransferase YjiC (YdhE family)